MTLHDRDELSLDTPLPPPRPSFNYGARPSTDSIRSLAEHSYSPLFTNGLYNSATMDLHRPNPPSPPGPTEHLATLIDVSNLPDPSTFSTPLKKKSSTSLMSTLSSKSPFSRRRERKQSTTTTTTSTASMDQPGDTPGKRSLASSQSSSKASPARMTKGHPGGSRSPYKSPNGKSAETSAKRIEREARIRSGKLSTGPYTPLRAPRSDMSLDRSDVPKSGDEDIEMMETIDPAVDLQNDISALETINDILGLPLDKTPRQQQVPKKKRSLLGFAVRGGSKVPFVDDDGLGKHAESAGRKSGGWVRASMEHFSRDAPTPPPMTPLPPLPHMMNGLSINATNLDTPARPNEQDSNGKRPNLKPFRLRNLLNLNMGTPKKQTSVAQMHASPASFVGGGRVSPGESPMEAQGPFSSFSPVRTEAKEEPYRPFERAHLDLPPRPGTSLGTYTPKKKSSATHNGIATTTSASIPVLSLPSGAHWSNSNPTKGRGKMSMGPGSTRAPPPRPNSKPSLGPETVLASRPSLSEIRERALSPPPSARAFMTQPRSAAHTGQQRLTLVSRSTSNSVLSERSSINTPVPRSFKDLDKRSAKLFGDKAESPLEILPFQNGDGWSTPYPPKDAVDVEIGKVDVGYPFPAVPAIPKIKSPSSSRSSIFEIKHNGDKSQKASRSRFDSSAFEYQAFETEHLLMGEKEARDSSASTSGWNGYETTKSSGFGSARSSRPGSRMGGMTSENAEDKENQQARSRDIGSSRSRPLPAVLTGGRDNRRAMRG